MLFSTFFALVTCLFTAEGTHSVRAENHDTVNVLFVSDSHGGGVYGKTLDGILRRRDGVSIATFSVSGSSPSWWLTGTMTKWGYFEKLPTGQEESSITAKTPLLPDLVNEYQPSVILIEQGTNLLPEGSLLPMKEQTAPFLAELERLLPPKTLCYWLGPPKMRRFSDEILQLFYQALEQAILETHSRCRTLDSRVCSTYPASGGDGIHYDTAGPEGREAGRHWAECQAEEISLN